MLIVDNRRERSRGAALSSKSTNEYYSQWATCAESTRTLTGTYSMPVTGKTELFQDYMHPGFHKRKAHGEIFMSHMYQHITEAVLDTGSGALMHWNGTQQCSGITRPSQIVEATLWEGVDQYAASFGPLTHPVYVAPKELHDPSDIDALLIEHQTRVLSERGRSDTDLFESLAQADQAVGTLPSLFDSIRKIVGPGKSLGRAKSLAQAWLIYRYGVKPLLGDIVGVVEGLEKSVGVVRRTTRSTSHPLKKTELESKFLNATIYTHSILAKHEDTVNVRVMSLDEHRATMLYNIGFSGKSLITLPWELIPYSFVVDWFANVGEFLGSLVPDLSLKQLGSCTVVQRDLKLTLSQGPCSTVSSWVFDRVPSGVYTTSISTKIRNAAPLQGGFVLKSDFRLSSLNRALDSLSLLLQKIRT